MMKKRQNKHKGISQRLVIIGIGVLAVIVVSDYLFRNSAKQTKPDNCASYPHDLSGETP